MYDADAIEAINIDQLVTATDRLLLRRGNVRRLESRRSFDLAHEAALAVAASNARAAAAAEEQTMFVRTRTWRGLFSFVYSRRRGRRRDRAELRQIREAA